MTRRFFPLFTTVALCTILTGSAFASSPTVNTERNKVVSTLEHHAHRLEWDAQATKGAPRALRELQSLRVQKLI